MNFHILTLFPEMVLQGLNTSITGRAIQQNKIGLEAVNIRDFTDDKHGRVDDYTYGGGAGMLMQAEPVFRAYQSVAERLPDNAKRRVIYVTPQGTPFTQHMAQELSENDDLVLLCGHYEGVDERVLTEIVTDYISIGDYVLTGGELAAMVIVDAVARLVPDVLHNEESAETESFHGNLLEYPQYSRPREWHGREVPAVLLSGNQRRINEWRKAEALQRTKERRPDLYRKYMKLEACSTLLMRQKLLHMDMIELISRGRAVLVARQDTEILLEDTQSHFLFHTWLRDERRAAADKDYDRKRQSGTLLRQVKTLNESGERTILLHQKEFVAVAQELGFSLDMECLQAVCTRREQLSISGLYEKAAGDGICARIKQEDSAEPELVIAPLGVEYCAAAEALYRTVEQPGYVRERIEKGAVYGAFCEGELAGMIGVHSEGGIGMLEVVPKFRRRRIAMALETYLCNVLIEQGMIPYGQIVVGNDASAALQEKLCVCIAKGHVYWMSRR